MNWFLFKQSAQKDLNHLYESKEASNIIQILAEELLPHYTQFELKDSSLDLNKEDLIVLTKSVDRLKTGEPLQYILGKTWFYNMELTINNSVLIPRPETEELVHWIIQDWKKKQVSILDIGTGSGCIPLTLAKNIPNAQIEAIDVSPEALELAHLISCELNLDVNFQCLDILDDVERESLKSYDVIVSNPPYIPCSEKNKMKGNVLDYEPHLALFVDNEDPLIFYKEISKFALLHLNQNGALYFECNEYNAKAVGRHMQELGFVDVTLQQDLQGKDRMVKGSLPYRK